MRKTRLQLTAVVEVFFLSLTGIVLFIKGKAKAKIENVNFAIKRLLVLLSYLIR